MIVVSDSSPLVSLAAVGQFALLRDLFGRVLIPEAVYQEVVGQGQGRPGAREVAATRWIERHTPTDVPFVRLLNLELDTGEAEAIALATEHEADVVLLDERRGRERAVSLGLEVTGTLGVLVEAKRQGYLIEVRPILDALRDDVGFWMSDGLYEHVLVLSGERL